MKIFMLWSYYDEYLDCFYKNNPNIRRLSFDKQRERIFDDYFGWPAELARYMRSKGHDVEFVIRNAYILQNAWAREHNIREIGPLESDLRIVLAQIKSHKPDLLLLPNPINEYYAYIDGAKGYYEKLAFYLGHSLSNVELIKRADLLFAINRKYVLNKLPEVDNLFNLGAFFPSKVLKEIGTPEKKYNVVFIGSITEQHTRRAEILAYLVENGVDLKLFSTLPKFGLWTQLRKSFSDIIRARGFKMALSRLSRIVLPSQFDENIKTLSQVCRPPMYGLEYYECIASAKICLNVHIDIANQFSGNIRMYDVTGVGTCLITDKKESNSALFDVSKEILEFDSKEDLLKILKNAQNNNYSVVENIAKQGQKKTLLRYTESTTYNNLNDFLKTYGEKHQWVYDRYG